MTSNSEILPADPHPVPPRVARALEGVLSVQRPVVLAHLRALRRAHPEADPAKIQMLLERRYLAAVTTGGAAVGASSAIPAVGVGASLALSGAETIGFLETSALFAQSVTELHGIALEDERRASTLAMTMILGDGGVDLVRQLAAQATGTGPARNAYWGELVGRNLPGPALGLISDRVTKTFLQRFSTGQGANVVGRLIPFGVGAVIGATGNHLLARRVVTAARTAFPAPPSDFPSSLAPREISAEEQERIARARELRRRRARELFTPAAPWTRVRRLREATAKRRESRARAGDENVSALEESAGARDEAD